MNNELGCLVKETSDELSYRKKYYPDGKSIKNDDLSCTICNETLTKKSFNLHSILGILLCKKCFEKNKSPDKKKCMVCNGGKKLIECKSKKCFYFTCEECMTKINSKAKSYYKQGKWNCFACHISPLYKLRGISAAVAGMSSDSIEKSSNQPNKRIKNIAKDKSSKSTDGMHKTNGQPLARSDSTSSSGTEFTKNKIIDTSLSSLRVNHHDLSDISEDELNEDNTLTNRQLLDFKHNVKKLFDGLKEMGNKMLNDVDKAQHNFYTNKHKKFKPCDVVSMISECKNIIQNVQDCTNKQEKKLIERHKTWCRKSKIKNTLFDNNNDKPTKKQNTLKKNIDKRIDISSDEEGDNNRASTPIEVITNKKSRVEKSNNNCQLEVSDCDEQVFSGNEADKIATTTNNLVNQEDHNNDVDMEDNSLDVSKDLFSDCDDLNINNESNIENSLLEQIQSSNSSKKSSDESNDENDKRKKRFLKVKKSSEKIDSDESTDSAEKIKPIRRLSKTKLDKAKDKDLLAKEIKAKEQLLKSSSSDNTENDNNNKNDSEVLLTPESQVKILTYDAETDKEENNKDKQINKSSDSELTEVEDPLPTKGSRKQIDDNNSNKKKIKTDVNNPKKSINVSSESDYEEDKAKKQQKEKEANKSLINSSESEHEEDDDNINKKINDEEQAKRDVLKSSPEPEKEVKGRDKIMFTSSSDSDQEKSEKEKEAKKILFTSSSESDNESKQQQKKKEDEEAKKAILNSSSDSEHDNDGDKIKKKEEDAKKSILNSSSESDNDSNQQQKKKEDEEAKKAILNSSSDSEHDNDRDKIKKKEDAKKSVLNSSSESEENEENNEAKKQKEDDEKAKKSLLNSSSDSDNEKNDKLKKQKEDDDKAKKSLLNSSSDSDYERNNINKKDEQAKNAILNSSDSEFDNEVIINNKRVTREATKTLNSDNYKDKNNSSDSDNDTISSKNSSRLKSKKLQLNNNIYYKKDKKLKLKCIVELNQLSKKILAKHSKALHLSTEYLENKKISSLISLDGLEKKKKKKNRSDSSADESTHSRSRKKVKLADDDTLLDHLKKVETGNGDNDSNNSGIEDDNSNNKIVKEVEPSLVQEADELAKASILNSSDSSEIEETPMEINDSQSLENDDKNKKKKDKHNKKDDDEDKDNNDNDDNDDENKKKRDDSWKRSKLLTSKILDSDSDEENAKAQRRLSQRSKNDESDSNKEEGDDSFQTKKKKVNKTRRRRLDSDSDVKISDDSSSDIDKNNDKDKDSSDGKKKESKNSKRKKRSTDSSDSSLSLVSKKNKTKRRRIRAVADDSDDSSDDDLPNSQGGTNKSGRKNIRKVLKDKHVADGTLQAAKQEEERIRRMAERQKLYNEMYEARLASEAKVDKLVLDFDADTKKVLLEVDENLVKRLKPHQAKGIKFMWDACFESLERTKESEGSGCILAHCMGLGKSFQVVSLSHTLLTHSEKTGINTILIVVPLSTVLNWMNEFKIWLSEVENGNDIELYEMTKAKTNLERRCHLENWQRTGGVLIIGYEMFRNLCAIKGKVRKTVQEAILKCILDPGPDLIICDEGHLLKNEDSAISKAIRRVKTLRRIVLTGTPLQNNLIEYHCMVQFVKPNLLGTKKEFSNRFVNPIQNGQFDDSTEYDVKLMKKRAHVLHKMLEGSVQRFDYSVLTPFLPPKQEYVISIRLTDVQVKLYQYYIDNFARKHKGVGGSLFADFQALSRLWTHPFVVKLHTENNERLQQKKREAESDSEGSLKDFIDDGSDSESSPSESSNNSSNESDVIELDNENGKKNNKSKPPPPKRGTRANPVAEEIPEPEESTIDNKEWWTEFVKEEDFDDMRLSAKLMILFDIIKEAEAIGDKVLVFSQSLYSLTLIEKFLGMIDDETQNDNELETLGKHTGCWAIGQDYFRFDGQTSAENRSHWVKSFNRPSNTRARLFLISTRAGGLGINLTAANRVVIFDASWNPSHDVQSIFRIYRFGQKKPCYVYRLLAAGTMEEKIYNRQVTKLSLSCRVVDELQIERHYSNNDLAELYKFDPPSSTIPDLALPKDRLLAEIFLRHKNLVETFHEHDSLLENIAEEELDAEERKQAWQEYEDEKAGKRMVPPQMMINYQNHQQMLMMQQYNNQMMNSLNMSNPIQQVELSQLMSMFQQDYPHLTEQAQRNMAVKALSNMYNYVENQVVGRGLNPSIMTNATNVNSNPTATLANALAQQEYSRFHSGYNQQQNLTPQQRQMMYSQSYGNSFGKSQQKSTVNPTTAPSVSKQFVNDDSDDIIEIPTSSSTRVNQASNSPKRQEE